MIQLRYALSLAIALAAFVAACSTEPSQQQRSNLNLEIFVAEPDEINVTSALIMGPSEMMVVSAQGTKSAATRLADRIEATGLDLRYIFLTHPHLDHSQGAGILLERFPGAEFVTTPEIAFVQKHRMAIDDVFAKARYGDNAAIPSVPVQAYRENTFLIDGETIEIGPDIIGDIGLGNLTEPHVALYVPSLHALIPSDVVYYNGYVMTGGSSAEHRAKWIAQLDDWLARDFAIVVPGHMPKTSADALTAAGALSHTRNYVAAYDRALAAADASQAVIAQLLTEFPELQHPTALYLSAFIDFQEMRNLSFDPADKVFDEGLTDAEIAEIDRKKFQAFRAAYNPGEN